MDDRTRSDKRAAGGAAWARARETLWSATDHGMVSPRAIGNDTARIVRRRDRNDVGTLRMDVEALKRRDETFPMTKSLRRQYRSSIESDLKRRIRARLD